MVTIEHSVVVERSIEDVFEFVTDDRNIRLCQLDAIATPDSLKASWPRRALDEVNRCRGGDPLPTNISLYKPRRDRSDSDSFPFDGEHILEPLEGATRYTLVVDVLLANRAKRQMETSLNMLKAILEGEERAAAKPLAGLSGSREPALSRLTA